MKLFILNRCSYGIGKRVVEAHAMAMEHQINAYRFFILLGLIFADVVTLSFQHRLSMLLDPFWTGFAFVSISISLYIALQTRKAIKAKKFEFEIPYLSVLAEISMVLIFVKSLLSGHIPTPYSIDQGLQIMVLIVMVFNILGALRISKFVIVFQTISFFFILTWGFYRAPLHDALSIYFSAFVLVSGVLSIWIADIIMDSYIAIQNATQANEKLVNANEEIKLQNEEITTQRDQLEFQRDTVLRQSKRITDSIHYAERIQRAVFPQASQLDTVFPKNILFFRPRDIVSGDFIWLQEYDGRVYFALADCTGHGVPGAFMSMLGSSLLTELLRREIATQKIGTRNAAFFLDELRGAVKQALHQTGEVRESKDGMDMAFVIWDKN
ncbi:MAG: hypothetical protein RIS47_1954, partial [Bacteroidota bacterium]